MASGQYDLTASNLHARSQLTPWISMRRYLMAHATASTWVWLSPRSGSPSIRLVIMMQKSQQLKACIHVTMTSTASLTWGSCVSSGAPSWQLFGPCT